MTYPTSDVNAYKQSPTLPHRHTCLPLDEVHKQFGRDRKRHKLNINVTDLVSCIGVCSESLAVHRIRSSLRVIEVSYAVDQSKYTFTNGAEYFSRLLDNASA